MHPSLRSQRVSRAFATGGGDDALAIPAYQEGQRTPGDAMDLFRGAIEATWYTLVALGPLALSLAAQEMVLGLWPIIKGSRQDAVDELDGTRAETPRLADSSYTGRQTTVGPRIADQRLQWPMAELLQPAGARDGYRVPRSQYLRALAHALFGRASVPPPKRAHLRRSEGKPDRRGIVTKAGHIRSEACPAKGARYD